MRSSIVTLAAVLAVLCAGSGCATIAQSTGIGNSAGSDLVAINSKPPGATVHIDGVQIVFKDRTRTRIQIVMT